MKLLKLNARLAVTIIILINFIPVFLSAQEEQNLKTEIRKLSLFKNGLGFLVSEAVLPENTKTIKIGQLPLPSFGTFWVGYPEEVKVKSLITSIEEVEKKSAVQNIQQLLQLNAGKKVLLHTSDKDIEGVVLANTVESNEQFSPNPYFMSMQVLKNPYSQYVPQIPFNDILKIETEKGIVLLNASSVIRAEFNEKDLINFSSVKEKYPSIRMELEESSGGKNLSISSIARGITWLPGYLIDLSNAETAKFNAHAVIINELADLNNVEVQLVTGFPNIKFADVVSPVAKSQSLAEFLNTLTNTASGNRQNQYMITQQALLSNVAGQFDSEGRSLIPEYSSASEGMTAEDFFFYPVKNFTLKNNETAWIPLFTAEMTYEHIYTWKIKDFVDNEERYYTQSEPQNEQQAEVVWHSCRLVNSLNMPLTTASAEFITNGEFTGQDVCYYTPPKGETTIKINKALNVLAEQTEIEIERKRDASVFHGYRYDWVKVRGELKIKNKLDKNIKLEISKQLTGEVLESSLKCKDVKTAKGLKQVNEKHQLTWEIDLAADDEKNISYQYQVYIKN
jgi:hypothetical protein